MIRVFKPYDKVFTSNGDIVVNPIKAKLYKKDNGEYYVTLETDLSYIDYIKEANLLVCDTPTGVQAFRISNIELSKSRIMTKAYHVFFDSKNYMIAGASILEKSCSEALQILNGSTNPITEFTTTSDILNINSYTIDKKSLYEAITETLNIYGGHLVRDNFNIAINAEIGQDSGIVVEYRKNLKDINVAENWSNVCTIILPIGKDNTLLDTIYVESDIQYDIPYVKVVEFNQDEISEEDYETESAYIQALKADLLVKANNYLDEHVLPNINYTLKANLDKVTDIGDVIEVRDERLNISLLTNVIGFVYDLVSGKYSEVEFGNFKKTLEGFASKVSNDVKEAKDSIKSAFTESYVLYDGSQLLALDTLPKEIATNVLRLDSRGLSFSESGINGTFKNLLSINGILNLNNFNLEAGDILISLDSSNGWTIKSFKSGRKEAFKTLTINSSDISWNSYLTAMYSGVASVSIPDIPLNAAFYVAINSYNGIAWICKTAQNSINALDITFLADSNSNSITISIYSIYET